MVVLWPNGSSSIPRVTREFGYKSSAYVRGYHEGIDTVGHTYNHAAVGGTVIMAAYNGTAGNEVRVRGDDGHHYRYMHHKSMLVRNGQRVEAGQRLGVMGATGMVTGVHCHWEIWLNGGTRNTLNPRTHVANNAYNGVPASVSGGQRTVGVNSVNGRKDASTAGGVTQTLNPGTVANFDGWKRGENVQGNNVWYHGAISGDWFWSGGFKEGANGAGLKDMNPVTIGAKQRKVGPNGANGRSGPATAGGVTQTLAPGTIADFNAWSAGENVEGNNIWFRGAYSGDWFWSGGFEGGANKADLEDLSPKAPTTPALGERQRKTGPNASNGRKEPNTSSEITATLNGGGTVGDFDAWTKGQSVEGKDIWLRGAHSGAWFWIGGLEPQVTTGLPEFTLPDTTPIPTPTPTPSTTQRTVTAEASANGRTGPTRAYNIVQSLDPKTVATFDAWTEGEDIEGINIWFRGALSKNWFWAGGFTSKETAGLERVTFSPPLDEQRTPVYPKASSAFNTPNGSIRNAGSTIDKLYVHHCAATSDQLGYFRKTNERSSCPTIYIRTTGEVIELIPPRLRPWSTGQADHSALAIETQNTTGAPGWGISDESHEAIAQYAAWMSQQKEIDGVPVTFKIDRQHILGHKEAPGASTACPGPSMDLARIVTRALQIVKEQNAPNPTPIPDPKPEPEPTPPVDPKLELLKGAWSAFKTQMDEYLS